jgi:hypothetical protein
VACWAEFAEFDGPNILHEGHAACDDYALGARYDWVCPSCFNDLKARQIAPHWRVTPPLTLGDYVVCKCIRGDKNVVLLLQRQIPGRYKYL